MGILENHLLFGKQQFAMIWKKENRIYSLNLAPDKICEIQNLNSFGSNRTFNYNSLKIKHIYGEIYTFMLFYNIALFFIYF